MLFDPFGNFLLEPKRKEKTTDGFDTQDLVATMRVGIKPSEVRLGKRPVGRKQLLDKQVLKHFGETVFFIFFFLLGCTFFKYRCRTVPVVWDFLDQKALGAGVLGTRSRSSSDRSNAKILDDSWLKMSKTERQAIQRALQIVCTYIYIYIWSISLSLYIYIYMYKYIDIPLILKSL